MSTIHEMIEQGLQDLPAEEEPRFLYPHLYLLMLEHNDGTTEIITKRGRKGPVVAIEGNQRFLRYIGDRLLQAKLIHGYQLLKTVGAPVYDVIEGS